jgi:hypothetical protein
MPPETVEMEKQELSRDEHPSTSSLQRCLEKESTVLENKMVNRKIYQARLFTKHYQLIRERSRRTWTDHGSRLLEDHQRI